MFGTLAKASVSLLLNCQQA